MTINTHSVRSPSGVLIATPLDGSPESQQDVVHCVHCSRLWMWEKGSGRRRGFCLKCGGFTCGNAKCDVCVPKEQQIDNLEAGLPANHVPTATAVSVPKLWTPDSA